MQAFGAGYGAYIPPPVHHNRSSSVGPPQALSTRASVSKAKSTTALRTEAMINGDREQSFQTLQDPRTASATDLSRRGSPSSSKGVDLEVAALSDKLISAINHQQVLDDTLAQTRHELDAARRLIRELEAKTRAQEEKVSRGDLVSKQTADKVQDNLRAELADARKERAVAQQEKRSIELELETLTASLFDEANKMVATANKERDAVEKKLAQLQDKLKDEESVIASQKEQLIELKVIMSDIHSEQRKEITDSPRVSLGPKSPRVADEEVNIARLLEAMDLEPTTPDHRIAPSPATKFTHLLRPQFRTDVPAYDDFKILVQSSESARSHNPSHTPSRAGSGSYGGLNVIGLGAMYNNGNSSSPNLSSQSANTSRHPGPQPLPGSFSPNTDVKGPTALKDTKFFKRVMQEDVEPALRLDLSPSISWLSRRSLLAAFADSTLIVEPIPETSQKVYGRYTPCSLCGESRRDVQNPRTHAMRVREGEGATKWPICVLCLEKVRAVGDLVTYVRLIRDGVVKCGDHREEIEAWEELIQLRERLFWARMAGGVVPSFVPSNKNSPITNDFDPKAHHPSNIDQRTPSSGTPQGTPRTSQEGETEDDKVAKQANLQLQNALDEQLTTFENAKDHMKKRTSLATAANSTPPNTPPRKNSTGNVFTKVSLPKLPQAFWESQVNTLH